MQAPLVKAHFTQIADEQLRIADALKAADVAFRHITVHSDKGHDSCLLEPELYSPSLASALEQPWIECDEN